MKTARNVLILFFLSCFFAVTFTQQTSAKFNDLPTITVINPIRGNELGHENENLLPGLQAQWQDTNNLHIPATWLWQYTALENAPLTHFAKSEMQGQEFGLFLEIDRNFAQEAGVQYRGRGPWYFSDGLLLVSYDQSERKKLIDTVFAKFKKTFGYYPKTVGAWWIGADSLVYMQQKYGITSALRAADQFNLDVYTIWGTPWSIPYLSSRENAGIPADSWDSSAKVVILQWAARDPTQGYGSSSQNSTYSIQDFELKNYNFSYFDYLSSVYLKQPLDQIVIGLENNASPTIYSDGTYYKKLVQEAAQLRDSHKITFAFAKDYAQSFLAKKNVFPPTHYFLTRDFKTNDQSFWYNSAQYRVGIKKTNNKIYLVDLRNYAQKIPEEFTVLPNSQGFLRIDTPAIIDSGFIPASQMLLAENPNDLRIIDQDNKHMLMSGDKTIASFSDAKFELLPNTTSGPINNDKQYLFTPNQHPFTALPIILIIFLLYFIFLFFYLKDKTLLFISCVSLVIPLLIAIPFLGIGDSDKLTFLFDRKELLLSGILSLPFGSVITRLTIFQIVPILLLIIFHYFFVVLLQSKVYKKVYLLYAGFVTLLYLNTPYFPIDKSTILRVGGVLAALFSVVCLLTIIILFKNRAKSIHYIVSFGGIILAFIVFMVTILLSRSTYALAPFEIEALQVITTEHKDVVYLFPTERPIYKAVRPVLYDDYYTAGFLTQSHWQKITRNKGNNLALANYENKILVVPSYLGSDLSDSEAKDFGLSKIFDNANIALFEKTK